MVEASGLTGCAAPSPLCTLLQPAHVGRACGGARHCDCVLMPVLARLWTAGELLLALPPQVPLQCARDKRTAHQRHKPAPWQLSLEAGVDTQEHNTPSPMPGAVASRLSASSLGWEGECTRCSGSCACLRACVHAYVRASCVCAHVHACVIACMRALVSDCNRAGMCVCVRACVACARACVPACSRALACVSVCVCARTHYSGGTPYLKGGGEELRWFDSFREAAERVHPLAPPPSWAASSHLLVFVS